MNPPYWLDANVFIASANGPYSFSLAPGFWRFLDQHLLQGTMKSSETVCKEVVPCGDDLSRWVKARKQKGLCCPLTAEVQSRLTQVADHISFCGRYSDANINDFLRGADPWMIAHVLVSGGTLVTNETALRPDARKIRIPDVCQSFQVRCITCYDMLSELGANFT